MIHGGYLDDRRRQRVVDARSARPLPAVNAEGRCAAAAERRVLRRYAAVAAVAAVIELQGFQLLWRNPQPTQTAGHPRLIPHVLVGNGSR